MDGRETRHFHPLGQQSGNKPTSATRLHKTLRNIEVNVCHIALLPRDASAERGDATVSHLSVRLSVCP